MHAHSFSPELETQIQVDTPINHLSSLLFLQA